MLKLLNAGIVGFAVGKGACLVLATIKVAVMQCALSALMRPATCAALSTTPVSPPLGRQVMSMCWWRGRLVTFWPARLAMVEHLVSGHFSFAGLLEDYIMLDAARFNPLACRH